ncbi:MAG: hypothetical protein KF745_02800 [Phycisphaeraceae bacterium]|nr:hypothetical protein [Phycisphaeraceae bacterium]
MMNQPNPFYIARDAQQMAKHAPERDAAVFNKVAMVCMGVMAAASVVGMLQPLLRGLKARDEKRTRDYRGPGR